MQKDNRRRNQAFTIIELVVVIVIIGILAATALPRFVDLTGDAQSATVEAMGGALTTGINLTHASWIAQGATAAVNSTSLEGGIVVGMNDLGWPENGDATGGDGSVDAAECATLWNSLLAQAPAVATDDSAEYQAAGTGTSCTYTYTVAAGRSIVYNSATGQVTTTVP